MSSKENAAISQLLGLLEARYAIRVLWALRDGHAQTFRLLQDSVGGITPNTLNTRIKELREAGLVNHGSDGYVVTARRLGPAQAAGRPARLRRQVGGQPGQEEVTHEAITSKSAAALPADADAALLVGRVHVRRHRRDARAGAPRRRATTCRSWPPPAATCWNCPTPRPPCAPAAAPRIGATRGHPGQQRVRRARARHALVPRALRPAGHQGRRRDLRRVDARARDRGAGARRRLAGRSRARRRWSAVIGDNLGAVQPGLARGGCA